MRFGFGRTIAGAFGKLHPVLGEVTGINRARRREIEEERKQREEKNKKPNND